MDRYILLDFLLYIIAILSGAWLYRTLFVKKPVEPRKRIAGKWIFEQTVFHCTHPLVSHVSAFTMLGVVSDGHGKLINQTSVGVTLSNGNHKTFKVKWDPDKTSSASIEPGLFDQAEAWIDSLTLDANSPIKENQ